MSSRQVITSLFGCVGKSAMLSWKSRAGYSADHVMSWCASYHGGYTIGAMCMCVHLLSFGHVGFLSAVFDSGMLVDIVCASISCVNKNT